MHHALCPQMGWAVWCVCKRMFNHWRRGEAYTTMRHCPPPEGLHEGQEQQAVSALLPKRETQAVWQDCHLTTAGFRQHYRTLQSSTDMAEYFQRPAVFRVGVGALHDLLQHGSVHVALLK